VLISACSILLECPQLRRTDHFSNIVAVLEFSSGCYVFTVSNSGLLFYTKHVSTTPISVTDNVVVLIIVMMLQNNLIFTVRRNARIASAVVATAIPSICPSVRHTLVLCQNDGT